MLVLASALAWLAGGFGLLAAVALLWWWANRHGARTDGAPLTPSTSVHSTATTPTDGHDQSLEEARAQIESLTAALEQEKARSAKVESELRAALESSLRKDLEAHWAELANAHDIFVGAMAPVDDAMQRFRDLVHRGEVSWGKLRVLLEALKAGTDPNAEDPEVLKVRVPVTRAELVAPLNDRDPKAVLGQLRKLLHPDNWEKHGYEWVTRLFDEITKRLNGNLDDDKEEA